jgi:type I restriction enzyme R subunit
LALFSNKEARKTVLVPALKKSTGLCGCSRKITEHYPDYQAVDDLLTEDQQLEFIKAFRESCVTTHANCGI